EAQAPAVARTLTKMGVPKEAAEILAFRLGDDDLIRLRSTMETSGRYLDREAEEMIAEVVVALPEKLRRPTVEAFKETRRLNRRMAEAVEASQAAAPTPVAVSESMLS